MDDVEAVVLVGGKGTRLRPLTLSAPKPMLPTAGVPFLAHLLSRIRAAGVRHVVLGTSYLAETFSAHFGDGEALGLQLTYVVEDEPLGTAWCRFGTCAVSRPRRTGRGCGRPSGRACRG